MGLPLKKQKCSVQPQERRTRARKAPGFGSRRGQTLSMGLTRAELIEKFRYKVRVIAIKISRNFPSSVDVDDLFSMGFLGLMDAADKFDPKKGVQFQTYAEYRIRGAILDGLREQDWVPRSARDRMQAVRVATENLESRSGRKPNDIEISQEMQMPLGKFHEMMMNLGSQTLVNLEDLPENILEKADPSQLDPFRETVRKEAQAVVKNMLQNLDEQEQSVLKLYYYRGLNFREISEIMELTESRICQIHSNAVIALKNKLKPQTPAVENIFLALMEE